MESITVKRNDEHDITFTGELLASVTSSGDQARCNFSGTPGRWTELSLYQTKGGKLVCERIDRTCWEGEWTRYSGAVCESDAEVIAFFGYSSLAKELYKDTGIDAAVEVE